MHHNRMIFRSSLFCSGLGILVLGVTMIGGVAKGAEGDNPPPLTEYVAKVAPPEYDDPDKALAAFKDAVTASDFDKLAGILGLDAQKLRTSEGVMDTFDKIKEGTAKKIVLGDEEGHKVVEIGEELWPFPFPITKGDDGKWAFDTRAGIEEVINRRIGENELEAIAAVRAYVDAQEDYAQQDHDGDGVLEYAQKLISSPGKTDGLYWPEDQGTGESPAGSLINQVQLGKAREDKGYYGYRFKILTRQGNNIAGGAYDYVINGNMIAGFALVAWPVKYGETGVNTFVVNRNGIVYQADLGEDTDRLARDIQQFNPNDNWEITED